MLKRSLNLMKYNKKVGVGGQFTSIIKLSAKKYELQRKRLTINPVLFRTLFSPCSPTICVKSTRINI